jgi:hypothetical protein
LACKGTKINPYTKENAIEITKLHITYYIKVFMK